MKGMQEQNEESQGQCKGHVSVAERRSKDSAVTVSVVIVQIFHERINKLRPFTKKKKLDELDIIICALTPSTFTEPRAKDILIFACLCHFILTKT